MTNSDTIRTADTEEPSVVPDVPCHHRQGAPSFQLQSLQTEHVHQLCNLIHESIVELGVTLKQELELTLSQKFQMQGQAQHHENPIESTVICSIEEEIAHLKTKIREMDKNIKTDMDSRLQWVQATCKELADEMTNLKCHGVCRFADSKADAHTSRTAYHSEENAADWNVVYVQRRTWSPRDSHSAMLRQQCAVRNSRFLQDTRSVEQAHCTQKGQCNRVNDHLNRIVNMYSTSNSGKSGQNLNTQAELLAISDGRPLSAPCPRHVQWPSNVNSPSRSPNLPRTPR